MTRQPNKGTQVPHGPTSQLPRYGGWAAKGLRATRRRPFGLAVGRFLSGDAALVKSRGRRQRGSAGVCFLGCGTGKVGLKVGSRAGGNSGREVEGTPKPSFSGLRPCDQPEQHTRAPTAKGLIRVLWFPTVPMLSSSCGLQLAFLVAFGEVHPGDRGDGRGNMWGTLNSDFHATCFVRTFVRAQNVQWIWGLHYCSHCRVDKVWNGVRTTFSVYPRCGPGDDGPDGCNLGVSEGLVSLWPMVGAAICRVASPNCVVAVWGTRVELGLPRVGDSSPSAETHRGSFSCGIHSDPLCSRAKSSKVPYDGCAKSMPSRARPLAIDSTWISVSPFAFRFVPHVFFSSFSHVPPLRSHRSILAGSLRSFAPIPGRHGVVPTSGGFAARREAAAAPAAALRHPGPAAQGRAMRDAMRDARTDGNRGGRFFFFFCMSGLGGISSRVKFRAWGCPPWYCGWTKSCTSWYS